MSDAVKIAIITALATALPIVITQVLAYLSQRKQLGEIHVQTNSNFDAQKREIKGLNDRIESLVKEKAESKRSKQR